MELTRSYNFNSHLLATYRLGERDLANVMRSRALRERSAVRQLDTLLPQLKEKATDRYSSITIRQNESEHTGWILATYKQHREIALGFIAVAMDDNGELWVGTPKYSSRTLEVNRDYKAPSVPDLAKRYQEVEGDPAWPLVSDQENEYVAATLQDPSKTYDVQLYHTLRPYS